MYLKNLLFIFILSLLYNCEGTPKKSTPKKNKIYVSKEIVIPIQEDEFDLSYLTGVKQFNDTTFIYRKSRYSQSIYVYNWTTKKRIKKIDFDDFGPNRITNFAQGAVLPISNNNFFIGTINNIYETQLDSVIFHAAAIKDTKKTKKNIYDNNEMFFITAQNHFPPFKFENKIYCRLDAANGNLGTDDYYNSKILMEYDLKDREFRKLDLSFPYFYFGKCWGPSRTRYSMTFNKKEELILMFPIKPRVYKYSLKTESIIDSIDIKSSFASSELKPVNCKASSKKKMFHTFSNPLFRAIKYDKYKNVYYVFITLPINKQEYDSVKNAFTLSPFSLLVLDSNFNTIAERKFKGGVYHTSDFFVTEEGLWLSKNSPHNPKYNENELRFDLIKYESK